MSTRLIIEGSAVYEIDEECIKKREQQSEEVKDQPPAKKNTQTMNTTNKTHRLSPHDLEAK